MVANRVLRIPRTRPHPYWLTESREEFDALRTRFLRDPTAGRHRTALQRRFRFVGLGDDAAAPTEDGNPQFGFPQCALLVLVDNLDALDGGQETVRHLDGWLTDPKVKKEIRGLLAQYGG
jgi:hypothetical protein